ncbi:hypothetical protein GCM10011529_07950 [Polymorphobacter glacialis]|uniref:Antifreeze protein n=1 Tax=Sandarakinorhabdus glacialis TaxID=1614636 RepID=A0A916ZM72_9SPHN|nr:hypothetical protein [Polymorphobacter glacialis]GGE03956.1 hypothetical protein GCM10011529_07950 [Polymorphobacter glacialis]
MIKKFMIIAAALIAAPVLAQDAAAPVAPAPAAVAPAAAAAAAPAAAPTLPPCSATVTDGCQQTARQEARAMTGAQVDKRDAAGVWTPDIARAPAAAARKKK